MQQPQFPCLEKNVSADEWQTRVNLAACYRLVALYGMDDLIYNHITARVPGTDHVLINPFGYFYEEITASSLIKIDLDGNVVAGSSDGKVNYAGYVIHSAVHAARTDVSCVLHTHTEDNMAVSVMAEGLLPYTITALRFKDRLGYHDFEGPAVDPAERERLVANLQTYKAMILRNHGALTCGSTIAEAFFLMMRLELSCRVQVKFLAANTPLHPPSESSQRKSAEVFAPLAQGGAARIGGQDYRLEWEAALRKLDRIDRSYAS